MFVWNPFKEKGNSVAYQAEMLLGEDNLLQLKRSSMCSSCCTSCHCHCHYHLLFRAPMFLLLLLFLSKWPNAYPVQFWAPRGRRWSKFGISLQRVGATKARGGRGEGGAGIFFCSCSWIYSSYVDEEITTCRHIKRSNIPMGESCHNTPESRFIPQAFPKEICSTFSIALFFPVKKKENNFFLLMSTILFQILFCSFNQTQQQLLLLLGSVSWDIGFSFFFFCKGKIAGKIQKTQLDAATNKQTNGWWQPEFLKP